MSAAPRSSTRASRAWPGCRPPPGLPRRFPRLVLLARRRPLDLAAQRRHLYGHALHAARPRLQQPRRRAVQRLCRPAQPLQLELHALCRHRGPAAGHHLAAPDHPDAGWRHRVHRCQGPAFQRSRSRFRHDHATRRRAALRRHRPERRAHQPRRRGPGAPPRRLVLRQRRVRPEHLLFQPRGPPPGPDRHPGGAPAGDERPAQLQFAQSARYRPAQQPGPRGAGADAGRARPRRHPAERDAAGFGA